MSADDLPLDPSERDIPTSEEEETEAPAEAPAEDPAEAPAEDPKPEELSPEELDRQTTHCPHCGTERQAEDFGSRFCSKCGLSVWLYAGADDDKDEDDEDDELKVRCRFCGVRGLPPRCTQCGHTLSVE